MTNRGDAEAVGLTPGSGRSPGVGNSNPLQYCCLQTLKDRGARQAAIHGVAESQTRLSRPTHGPFQSSTVSYTTNLSQNFRISDSIQDTGKPTEYITFLKNPY